MDQERLQRKADYLNEMGFDDEQYRVYEEGEALALARLTGLRVYPVDYAF